MFQLKIAEIVFQIENKYSYVKELCRDYIVEDKKAEFTLSCSDEEILEQQKRLDGDFSLAYAESLEIYRKICYALVNYDAFLMHASCVELDDEAYLFTAESGVGKTTHSINWLKAFGDRAKIINGDKPIIRLINGKPFVFGTPYCGKEGYNQNKKSPLKAICFINRGENNEIFEVESEKVLSKLISEVLIPKTKDGAIKTLDLIDRTLNKTKLFELICNMNVESAIIAYNKMRGNKNEN